MPGEEEQPPTSREKWSFKGWLGCRRPRRAAQNGNSGGRFYRRTSAPGKESAQLGYAQIQPRRLQMLQLKSVVSGPGSRCLEELISTPGLAAGYTAHTLCKSVIISKLHLYSGWSLELLMTTGGELTFFSYYQLNNLPTPWKIIIPFSLKICPYVCPHIPFSFNTDNLHISRKRSCTHFKTQNI